MPRRPMGACRCAYPTWGISLSRAWLSGSANSRAISSRGKLGMGSARPAATSVTPSARGTTWPMGAQATPLALARRRHAAGVSRVDGEQQRARGDDPERVEPERLAQALPLGHDGDALALDPEPGLGGQGQLPARGGDPALGGVVHRVDARRRARRARLRRHPDAGPAEELPGARDVSGGHTAADGLLAALPGDDGGPLDRHALGEEHHVADAGPARGDEPVPVHLAEHGADHHGLPHRRRHLGVTADQGHLERLAGLGDGGEQRLDRGVGGAIGGAGAAWPETSGAPRRGRPRRSRSR